MTVCNYTDIIVGGDSLIGSSLFEFLQSLGRKPCRTTRRKYLAASDHYFHIDLDNEDLDSLPDLYGATAYLLAGMTSIEECEKNPEIAYRVNVANLSALAKKLAESDSFIVYLSSSAVFDGNQPLSPIDTTLSPVSQYGYQKEIFEKLITELTSSYAIIRLAKVLSRGNGLIAKWIEDLLQGRKIVAFEDKYVSPISLPLVLKLLADIGMNKCPGIFQLSAVDEVSYKEIAFYIAEKLSVPNANIEIDTCGTKSHTSLDSSLVREKFDLAIPSSWQAIDYMLGGY